MGAFLPGHQEPSICQCVLFERRTTHTVVFPLVGGMFPHGKRLHTEPQQKRGPSHRLLASTSVCVCVSKVGRWSFTAPHQAASTQPLLLAAAEAAVAHEFMVLPRHESVLMFFSVHTILLLLSHEVSQHFLPFLGDTPPSKWGSGS